MSTFAEEYRRSIMWELDGAVSELNRTQITPSRMAFLVNEQEWDALIKWQRRFRHWASEDDLTEMPVTKMTYRGFEVRKRR